MPSDKKLSNFEIIVLWRVLLFGPLNAKTLAEYLSTPVETAQYFFNRLESKRYLERDTHYARNKSYVFVASSRRDTEEDLES